MLIQEHNFKQSATFLRETAVLASRSLWDTSELSQFWTCHFCTKCSFRGATSNKVLHFFHDLTAVFLIQSNVLWMSHWISLSTKWELSLITVRTIWFGKNFQTSFFIQINFCSVNRNLQFWRCVTTLMKPICIFSTFYFGCRKILSLVKYRVLHRAKNSLSLWLNLSSSYCCKIFRCFVLCNRNAYQKFHVKWRFSNVKYWAIRFLGIIYYLGKSV